ncbi:MAG TPA: glycosyltransferase [Candidatus Cloacimonetes bacterium]|nr:glycosyltransferase [Candidatus Cloacimonadota bacterium]HEX37852.1 glycosyltransferase [Candidatus Cloacimonadota bacterium]
MISVSLGIFAYNEEKNIGQLLQAVEEQVLETVQLKEIIVVSSASTDRTDEIVRQYMKKDPRIQLITQEERKGKSSAINLFLKAATGDVLIIESADTIPAKNTIEKLAAPFYDETIGMTGGRPEPINNPKSFIGFAVCMLWKLHHKMALISPKIGEMASFRNLVKEIPEHSPVDEASIESIITDNGLKLKYIPDAIIHNKGPENVSDFIKQRRRIYTGHLWLQKNQDYTVVSQNSGLIIGLTLKEFSLDPIKDLKIIYTMLLEVWGRFLGWFDFKILKKVPYKWDISESTKDLGKS